MIRKILFILLLCVSIRLDAVEPYLFKLWDTSAGLSDNTVKCIGQDKYGFLWLGTFDGLCRFDGKSFSVFRHEVGNNYSLYDNEISALACSDTGIWVGMKRGLSFYSFSDNRFHACYDLKGEALTEIKNIVVFDGLSNAILDMRGNIYLHVRDCLFRKLESTEKWYAIAPFKGTLCWAHSSSGLFLLDLAKGTVVSHFQYAAKGVSEVIYYSRNQELVYIGYGLNGMTDVFTVSGTHLRRVKMMVPEHVKAVLDYGDVTLFGTDGDGLVELRKGNYTSIVPKNSTLGSDAIFSLYKDTQNNLFVGTYRGGLNVHSPQYNLFQALTLSNGGLTQNMVTAVYQSGTKIYAGLDGGGLNIYDRITGRTQHFSKENSSLPDDNLLAISGDAQGLWLGTYKGGLSFYSFRNGTFKTYPLPDKDATLWSVKDDGKGYIWIVGNHTYRFDKRSFKYEEIKVLRDAMPSSVSIDGNEVWVSTRKCGVYKLNIQGRFLKRYTFRKNFVSDNNIQFIAVDSRHRKWVATEGAGIFLLVEDSSGHTRWIKLKNDVFQQKMTAFAEESPGIFWIGTFNGLYRYDEESGTSVKFTKNNNLPSVRFNYSASFKGNDGMMYWGTTGGLVYLKPQFIQIPFNPVRVFFTDIKLTDDKNTVINLYGDVQKEVRLPYNKNFFTIHFSAPETGYSDQVRYSYRMKNFDRDWRTSSLAQAEYTNLPPGEYDFHVHATTISGAWSKSIASLHIVITPPWWKTWWATSLWFVLTVMFLYVVFYFYMRDVKIKHKLRLQHVERKTEERINRLKMDFLVNIVHELRTPVFLISAPLEELASSGKKVVQAPLSYIQGIYYNALRLNKLIDRIIDFRKIESGALTLQLKRFDAVSYCKELSANFLVLCSQKHISYTYRPDRPFIQVEADPSKLDLILSNLISNAFKYTPEGGSVSLSISEKDNCAVFVVKDTGIGISPVDQKKVFDDFYQVNATQSPIPGDGIGLSFVKRLVALHGGLITLKSREKVGSEFTFTIPLKQPDRSVSELVFPKDTDVQKIPCDKLKRAEEKINVLPSSPASVYSVLIIDDDAGTVMLLENYLNSDFKVYHASDGDEGFQKAQEVLPDIIIADVVMSSKNGSHFISMLKKDKKTSSIPIIVLTGNTSEEVKLQLFRDGGVDAYLTKPVLLKYLRERMDYILKQSESRHLNIDTLFYGRTTYNKEEQAFLLRCRTVIDRNLTNSDFNVRVLAESMGLSPSSLYRKIKDLKDVSVIEFITDYRLFKAVQYFRKGETNISGVCDKCGFNDPKNFREAFKRKFQMTPRDFIKQL